jgi:hypothetical protein
MTAACVNILPKTLVDGSQFKKAVTPGGAIDCVNLY